MRERMREIVPYTKNLTDRLLACLLAVCVFLPVLVSCIDEDLESTDCLVTLTLSEPGTVLKTRATRDGEDAFNENVIKTVDLFLYPLNGTDQNAVVQLPRVPHSYDADTRKSTVTVRLNLSKFKALFPNYESDGAQTCVAYALVNRPGDVALPANTDTVSLNQIALQSSVFNEKTRYDPNDGDAGWKCTIPADFVMSGASADVALDNATKRTLTGDVPVRRAAVKVTITLTNVKDEVKDADNIYTYNPVRSGIRVHFKNGQTKGFVSASASNANSDGYFEKRDIRLSEEKVDDGNGNMVNSGRMIIDVPFFSYPTDWRSDITHRGSFVIMVPWKRTDVANAYQNTFYEIPINDGEEQLKRNTHYHINFEVGVMGSYNEAEAVKVESCSYIILPWGESGPDGTQQLSDIEATMKQLRYLAVSENVDTMNNVTGLNINYSASDPIEFVNKKMERYNLMTKTWDVIEEDQADAYKHFNIVDYPAVNEGENSFFMVEHLLNNTMTKEADYSDYRMTFTVQLKDHPEYSEDITVIQHPMIFVKDEVNSGASQKGYVFVNGSNSENANFGGVHGLTGSNTNENRYIVTATALTTDEYTIGDSRLRDVNNALTGTNITSASTSVSDWSAKVLSNKYPDGKTRYSYWWGSYYYLDNNGNYRTLQFYHPAEESDRTKSMIAPQFMVASSYGVTTNLSKENARKRCASYQEDGYPAGRWRLPTYAEVKYIVQLSTWGIIPILFGNTATSNAWSYYWTANGIIGVNNYSGLPDSERVIEVATANQVYVRAVYDTWYWGDDNCDKNTFTWGDRQ